MKKLFTKLLALTICFLVLFASSAAVADSWEQASGRWWYSRSDGSYAKSEWLQDGNKWYYFDASGWMVTGWQKINSNWFYFDKNGVRKTGWVKDGKSWYYMDSDGVMVTGWVQDGGSWYYMDPGSGAMATGWIKSDGNWYYIDQNGNRKTGWLKDGGSWYYMGSDGFMVTGWVQDGGKQYYMDASGAMHTGWKEINDKWYYFESNGVMATGWRQISGAWYYFDDGVMVTGAHLVDGEYCLFGADGKWVDNRGITVSSVKLQRDYIGYTDAFIRFKNNLSVAVDRIDFAVFCYDAYGEQIYGYDYYAYSNCHYDLTVRPGNVSAANHYWSLLGYSGVKTIEIIIFKYHTADGQTVEIPDDQQISYYASYN